MPLFWVWKAGLDPFSSHLYGQESGIAILPAQARCSCCFQKKTTAPGYVQALLCFAPCTLMREADLVVAGGPHLYVNVNKILVFHVGFPVRAGRYYVLCSALLYVRLT